MQISRQSGRNAGGTSRSAEADASTTIRSLAGSSCATTSTAATRFGSPTLICSPGLSRCACRFGPGPGEPGKPGAADQRDHQGRDPAAIPDPADRRSAGLVRPVTGAWRHCSQCSAEFEPARPDDQSPIDPAGVPSEISPLVESFNDLLLRLTASINSQKQFVADAAHQIKTPLAGLRTQAELALRQSDPAEVRKAWSAWFEVPSARPGW